MADSTYSNSENLELIEDCENEEHQAQFSELLKWEEESKGYLEQLEVEEKELRETVDVALDKNNSLRDTQSMLLAKIQAQHEARANVGVKALEKDIQDGKNELAKLTQDIDTVRMDTLTKSTSMMALQLEDTFQLDNRFKKFRSPHAVSNGVNTMQVKNGQLRSKIRAILNELDNVQEDVRRLEGQRRVYKVIQQLY